MNEAVSAPTAGVPQRVRAEVVGRRQWAEEHARRLQSLVGTQEAGTVSAVLAVPYAASRRKWCEPPNGVTPAAPISATCTPVQRSFPGEATQAKPAWIAPRRVFSFQPTPTLQTV